MTRRYPRLFLAAVGSAMGLGFGVTYWFAWGCRACAKDGSPWAIFAFCMSIGAAMAMLWGKDHLKNNVAIAPTPSSGALSHPVDGD